MRRSPITTAALFRWGVVGLAFGCSAPAAWSTLGGVPQEPSTVAPPEGIDFDRQIRPILANHCYACHGFDAHGRQADLRLDTREGALQSGSGDAIVPGDPSASQVVQRIQQTDPGSLMPPPEYGKPLSEGQKALLLQWIAAGADYREHWAFQPIAVAEATGVAEPRIDHWVAAGQRTLGLQFSPPAAPETLLRRVSLDLIGLPPTLAEQDAFLSACAVDPLAAYADTVERLLASPHYGERWARWWLDQARYADSNGYSVDSPRQIWLYRDWVVQALNQDLSFADFTVQQLAGDLLPDATESHRIATGFHRNTPHNEEGGIDVEQFRIEAVVDRVATTGTVWLGLTIGCAQCHDHKFDPISQAEFYRLFAFFNQQDEPRLKVNWSGADSADSAEDALQEFTTLVLQERSQRRPTHVLIKGDFTRPDQLVEPGTPSVLPPLTARGEIPNRLDLAQWLVSDQHPLTSRVLVNRVWQVYFGRGLVESENDFGLQGLSPSHPELLDELAALWMKSGWSLKQLHRWIVHSRTYQQSSVLTAALHELDPSNQWLARQQRLRLEAELVRDAILTASGALTRKVGGPPVYPPQPEGALNLGQVQRRWQTSLEADRYRRSLYTFTFRAVPPPLLNVFDAPEGVQSCTRRLRSNTPLQALMLMNDAGLFELAERLAEVIASEGLEAAFRRCTSRRPDTGEVAVLMDLSALDAARVLLNLDETISRE